MPFFASIGNLFGRVFGVKLPVIQGVVTTFAGSTTGGTNATGTNSTFNGPYDIAMDLSGNMYVPEQTGCRIRKITPNAVVTTLAGSGSNTSIDGTGTNATFSLPFGVIVDTGGNVYVAENGGRLIRKITPAGVVTTLAGGTAGSTNGTGTNARFFSPTGITIDSASNLYVTDNQNHAIRKITPAAVVTTFAGVSASTSFGYVDGTGTNAKFYLPTGIAIDSAGTLYVCDSYNHRIRKVSPTGVVTTLAGSATGQGTATGAFADGTGANASFNQPFGVEVDSEGTVYIGDRMNHRIRKITPAGVVTTIAGTSGVGGFANGTGGNARFNNPRGLVVSPAGVMYVADQTNQRIRKIV